MCATLWKRLGKVFYLKSVMIQSVMIAFLQKPPSPEYIDGQLYWWPLLCDLSVENLFCSSAFSKVPLKPFKCKMYFEAALVIWRSTSFTDFLIFLGFIISILSSLSRGYKPCKVSVKIYSFPNQNSFCKLLKFCL